MKPEGSIGGRLGTGYAQGYPQLWIRLAFLHELSTGPSHNSTLKQANSISYPQLIGLNRENKLLHRFLDTHGYHEYNSVVKSKYWVKCAIYELKANMNN